MESYHLRFTFFNIGSYADFYFVLKQIKFLRFMRKYWLNPFQNSKNSCAAKVLTHWSSLHYSLTHLTGVLSSLVCKTMAATLTQLWSLFSGSLKVWIRSDSKIHIQEMLKRVKPFSLINFKFWEINCLCTENDSLSHHEITHSSVNIHFSLGYCIRNVILLDNNKTDSFKPFRFES